MNHWQHPTCDTNADARASVHLANDFPGKQKVVWQVYRSSNWSFGFDYNSWRLTKYFLARYSFSIRTCMASSIIKATSWIRQLFIVSSPYHSNKYSAGFLKVLKQLKLATALCSRVYLSTWNQIQFSSQIFKTRAWRVDYLHLQNHVTLKVERFSVVINYLRIHNAQLNRCHL